jgi:hypothetical protein
LAPGKVIQKEMDQSSKGVMTRDQLIIRCHLHERIGTKKGKQKEKTLIKNTDG